MNDTSHSPKDGVCIDEEVFFGPITDKERKIREHFESACRNETKTGELSKIDENDISRNDSLYISFSVDDSKYDSFDDSLNQDIEKKSQGTKHAPPRKNFDKLKPKKHGFYDSLEDVCSLASNIEKCSISCEVENEKQHIIDDSLRNMPALVTNKSCCISDQINFDDDSLAIIELENTFEDSLEEFNVLSSIEIEEINDVDIITSENQNTSFTVEQNPVCTRNLFETSVQVIYERKGEADIADQEQSSGDRNMYDSLSNSDFKDILKDSLEESDKCIDNVLKHVLDASDTNEQKSKQLSDFPGIEIGDIKDAKFMMTKNESWINKNLKSMSDHFFDTSVQVICEKRSETVAVDPEELPDGKNILCDSLSSSDLKDILKDSLEESEKSVMNLKHVSVASTADSKKLEQMPLKSGILDNSVQIVYENLQNLYTEENISGDVTNSEINILKHSVGNLQNDKRDLSNERMVKTSFEDTSLFSHDAVAKNITVGNHNAICLDSDVNQRGKGSEDKVPLILSEPNFPISADQIQKSGKDKFTVDSCHLKLLNDNQNFDKDLKFELHIEVTVGDKKCKIAADDIKLIPATNSDSKINEGSPVTFTSTESESCTVKKEIIEDLDSCNSNPCYKYKESQIKDEDILFFDSHENNLYQEHKTINEANITQRVKSSVSEHISNSDLKLNLYKNINNENLFQALDLHDFSTSFCNESVIQSNDSVIPLNLCSREQDIKKLQMSLFRDESKENFPESAHYFKEKDICTPCKKNQNKLNFKTPKSLHKSPSFKETAKKASGTKIPVRKVEYFVSPAVASCRIAKQVTNALSSEKQKKHPHLEIPHLTEKKTPNKTPHFCKVRNTIFSKVPQIVPSKKYQNIQSPVAQYIRNTPGSVKMPILDPVLHDCMNHMHEQQESPYHLYQMTKSGSAKSAKRKV